MQDEPDYFSYVVVLLTMTFLMWPARGLAITFIEHVMRVSR